MRVIVDGLMEDVAAGATVADLIVQFGAGHSSLIVEVNGRYVHARDYGSFEVRDGDRVELILPAFGG